MNGSAFTWKVHIQGGGLRRIEGARIGGYLPYVCSVELVTKQTVKIGAFSVGGLSLEQSLVRSKEKEDSIKLVKNLLART